MTLNPEKSLAEQLIPRAFSIPNSPIWQDSSTTLECRELEAAVGGAQALADITGSRGYERFTGAQIKRVCALRPWVLALLIIDVAHQIRRTRPASYEKTADISLVSSFIASLFLGRIAPIDVSDASGMNLMDVLSRKWVDSILEVSGGKELRGKLKGDPVEGGIALGVVHPYWTRRWGFPPGTFVLTSCLLPA